MESILDSVERTFGKLDPGCRVLDQVVLTADSGFNSERAAQAVLDRGIEAYVADPKFRKRDPKFANHQAYKAKSTDRKRTARARKYFTADEFLFDKKGILICPAGKPMKSRCPNWRDKKKGYTGRTFQGYPAFCLQCELRSKCLRSPRSPARQVTKTDPGIRHRQKSAVQRMIERFDTLRGRHFYSQRMGTVEPTFADIRDILGLDRFTLRGRRKVDAQWKLYCTVHNIGKLARYGGFG